jgi:predicted nucleic acid-binding protein
MTASAFVDTNVLLYAVSKLPAEAWKRDAARALLLRQGLAVSAQVLAEFYVQATRAKAARLTHRETVNILGTFSRFAVVPVTGAIVFKAVDLSARHRISYWDAAILVAAREAGAPVLYSEDLDDGKSYDGVIVENPFRGP